MLQFTKASVFSVFLKYAPEPHKICFPYKATVLEEMPPFPERESSILAKLKKKKGPNTVTDLEETKKERNSDVNGGNETNLVNASTVVSFFQQHIVQCLLCNLGSL